MHHLAAPSLAIHACAACKAGKRKCTKELPGCRLCLKKNRTCDYTQPGSKSNSSSPPNAPNARSSSASVSQDWRHVQPLDLPNVLFLDSRILHSARIGSYGATPGHIMARIGNASDIQTFSSRFFDTIHYWMPIISMKRFHNRYASLISRPELALLLLCMKLMTEVPNENPQTSTYLAAKQFHLEVEISGILSIHALQAGVLIAVYELGHGIHPSGFLSIGACARYAYALGIDCDAKSQVDQPLTWVEQEETRRVWWAIVILDRLVGLGCRGRRFVTEIPPVQYHLPADDEVWNEGIMESNGSHTVSAPSISQMSKFALVAQAARLLGQVLEHISNPVNNPEDTVQQDIQLDRTVRSLVYASQRASVPACDAVAICYSALMALHEPRNPSRTSLGDSRLVDSAYSLVETQKAVEAATMVVDIIHEKLPEIVCHLDLTSPWGAFSAYQACITHARLVRNTSSPEAAEALSLLRQSLRTYDVRWKLAGAYLQLLEAREVMGVL